MHRSQLAHGRRGWDGGWATDWTGEWHNTAIRVYATVIMRGSRRRTDARNSDSHNMMVSERKRVGCVCMLHAPREWWGMNGGQIKTAHYLMTEWRIGKILGQETDIQVNVIFGADFDVITLILKWCLCFWKCHKVNHNIIMNAIEDSKFTNWPSNKS